MKQMQMMKQGFWLAVLLALSACSADSGFTSTAASRAAASTAMSNAMVCPEPRSRRCTREYRPVCALKADGSTGTYSNKCTACGNTEVQAYTPGACN